MVNGVELLGGAIALSSSILIAKKANPESVSRLAGGCLLSALVSANPALMTVAAGSMAYAFVKSDNLKNTFLAAGNGALVSGSALMVSSLIGGPIWIGCLSGVITAVLVSQAMTRTELIQQRVSELIEPAGKILSSTNMRIHNQG